MIRTPELTRAIRAAGGVTRLARAIGVTSAAVAQWHMVPAARIQAVSAATGIPPAELRPDLAEALAARKDGGDE